MSVGIANISVAIPKGRMSNEEMARRLQIEPDSLLKETAVKSKPILSGNEQLVDFAIDASRQALESSGVGAAELDYLVFGGERDTTRKLWSISAKIQKEIGAKNAFCFDLQNGCNSGALSLYTASQFLASDPEKRKALVVVGDALSSMIDYGNSDHRCLFNFSDGASAAILCKDLGRNTIRGYSATTNGVYADSLWKEANEPYLWMNEDEEEDKALSQEYRKHYLFNIQEALRKSGLSQSTGRHVFMNQGDHRLIDWIETSLSLEKGSIFRSHWDYGHLGGTDSLFGFKTAMDAGKIKKGDVVVLASSSVGYSWGALAIEA